MRYTKGIIATLTTKTQNNKKTKTYEDIITFDTESSRVRKNLVCTYLWSACINGEYVYGHTPQECYDFFSELASYSGNWYVWVHCLGFDYIYLDDVLGGFKDKDVFAISKYRPIQIHWENVTFRCTYAISNISLKDTAELYNLAHKKGEMDHDLVRHYETELTPEDWEYVQNDVLVLHDYVKMLQDIYLNLDDIPLTFTGCARKTLAEYIWKYSNRNGENPKYDKLTTIRCNILNHAPKSKGEYNSAREIYHGAYNFVNPEYLGVTITSKNGVRIISADIKSAYPFGIVTEMYPNKLTKINDKDENIINFVKSPFAIAKFIISDLKLKEDGIPCINKNQVKIECFPKEFKVINDQLVRCKYLRATLSTLDYQIMKEMYDFHIIKIYDIYKATMSYLPLGYIMMIKDLFSKKTLAKDERERMISKLVINAISGNIAFDYTKADVEYNDGKWSYNKELRKDDIQIINKIADRDFSQRKHMVLNNPEGWRKDNMSYCNYQWAGLVTAYTKRDLLLRDKLMGLKCVIRNDTDCMTVVCANDEELNKFFKLLDDIAKESDRKLQAMCDYMNKAYGTDLKVEDFRPTDYDSTLGHMPIEHDMYKFKMLKKKTYLMCEIVEHEGREYHVITPVISGANKQIALETLLLNIKPEYQTLKGDTILSHYSEADLDLIFERFSYDLIIPNGTKTHFYTPSTEEDIEVTDHNGKTITLHGVTKGLYIEPRDFSLSNMPDLESIFIYSGLDAGNGTLGC